MVSRDQSPALVPAPAGPPKTTKTVVELGLMNLNGKFSCKTRDTVAICG